MAPDRDNNEHFKAPTRFGSETRNEETDEENQDASAIDMNEQEEEEEDVELSAETGNDVGTETEVRENETEDGGQHQIRNGSDDLSEEVQADESNKSLRG